MKRTPRNSEFRRIVRIGRATGWLSAVTAIGLVSACSQQFPSMSWLKNGLLDPSQSGNFEKPVRLEIRDSVSVLDEPMGIQDAEEPTEEDVAVTYEELPIGPGDFLRVTVFELLAPSITSELQFQVRASGYETFPVVGPVRVAGMRPRELELSIKDQLREAGILENADVQVTVLRSESQQYSVVGGVVQPGNYPLTRPNLKLLNALAAAGGLPPQAQTVIVIRNGAANRGMDFPSPPPTSMPGGVRPMNSTLSDSPVFTMSDVSPQGVAGATTAPATTTRAAGEGQAVDELEILEGGPKPNSDPPTPIYNPETGEWEVGGVKPVTTMTGEPGDMMRGEHADEGEFTSDQPASMPTTAVAGDGEMFPETEESLIPSVRILEIPAKALREGDPRYNVVIRPSDLIDVPVGDVGEFYMYGNVSRPGAYQLTGRRITVKQAIASAGGFGPLALPSRADLIRRVGKDEEQFIQIDLDAIFAGTAPDFYLRPNDIVNVGSSPVMIFLAVVRNAFRFSYGFGFVYDRNFADSDSFFAQEQVKQRRRLEAQQRGLPF